MLSAIDFCKNAIDCDQIMAEVIGFKLETASGNTGQGTATLRRLSSKQVFTKGLRMCFGIWAVGAMTIFIPIVHFVSVPLLFIFGPIAGKLFANFQGAQSEYEDVDASCPDCSQALYFTAESGIEPPQLIKCPSCSHAVVILLERSTVPA